MEKNTPAPKKRLVFTPPLSGSIDNESVSTATIGRRNNAAGSKSMSVFAVNSLSPNTVVVKAKKGPPDTVDDAMEVDATSDINIEQQQQNGSYRLTHTRKNVKFFFCSCLRIAI